MHCALILRYYIIRYAPFYEMPTLTLQKMFSDYLRVIIFLLPKRFLCQLLLHNVTT